MAARPAPASPLKPPPLPLAREEAKAVIAARIAASAKLKVEAAKAARAAAERPTATGASSAQRPRLLSADANADALENSILAAIAEAVDVLVDDNSPPEPEDAILHDEVEDGPEPDEQAHDDADIAPEPVRRTASSAPKPAAAPSADDNDDIGDQIQRIIASYNRNRDA